MVSVPSMLLHPPNQWRTGILCYDCRLRPRGLPPYMKLQGVDKVDYCLGHYTDDIGLFIEDKYPVVVAVMR